MRDESGFTLMEVIGALLVVSLGVIALLTAFDAAGKLSFTAQRHQQATAIAQAEIEKLKTLKFSELALSAAPASAAAGNEAGDPRPENPLNPNYYVTGSGLKIMQDYRDSGSGVVPGTPATGEPFVVDASTGVDPGPETFDNGQATGRIYRYITWRNESCVLVLIDMCSGNQDAKRITVAVVIDDAGNGARPTKPIYVSSVMTDPNAAPPNSVLPPETNPGVAASKQVQPFFLYDTPCSQSSRQTITASHATRNTSQSQPVPVCTTTTPPDLMGADPPPDGENVTLYDYSSDLSRTNPRGLALTRTSATTCPTTYTSSEASTMKYRVHSWASKPFSGTSFVIPSATPRAFVQVWTKTVDGVAAAGTMCATIRSYLTGLVLGSATYTQSSWPTDFSVISFAFDLTTGATLLVGDRLVLTLSMTSASGSDIEIAYDHPDYQSFMSVTSTTPLG